MNIDVGENSEEHVKTTEHVRITTAQIYTFEDGYEFKQSPFL